MKHRNSVAPGIRAAKAVLASDVSPVCVGVDEAQTMSGISKWSWRRWAQTGTIDSIKVGGRDGKLGRGGRLLIPIAEIRRVLAENFRPRVEMPPANNPGAAR